MAHCRHGQHIPNSPFKIYVGESEIGNAGKVKVSGKGLTEGMANELNEFFVNTKDAGQYICFGLHVKTILNTILSHSKASFIVCDRESDDANKWVL